MIEFLPVLKKDFYKVGHKFQHIDGTTLVYSNVTARGTRLPFVNGAMSFSWQYWVLDHLMRQFTKNFFEQPRDFVVRAYKRRIDSALGPGTKVNHIGELHELGFLPLHVKAIPEGTIVPLRIPMLTLYNTVKEFYWLTNMVETNLSSSTWQPITSATVAFHYRKVFEEYAKKTGADPNFVKWQGHDFSYRGLDEVAAIKSGAAHLLSFYGTDTIPAIDFLEHYYGANSDTELIGGSVPATEHSVMCMGLEQGEQETILRLIKEIYPKGIVSIVSDTWDFWTVLTVYLRRLKNEIMARDGKVVVRPDSGDPVKIICGDPEATSVYEKAGAISVLWDLFGGTVNKAGFKELDPHIGLIYGDSITPERQEQILEGLASKGFASSNVVLGIGSFTYQYVTRDTLGQAVKATYGEVNGVGRDIFKKPKTDDGTKNSAKGLLNVSWDVEGPHPVKKVLRVTEGVSWADESKGVLQTIFKNGIAHNLTTLAQIRSRVEEQL